MDNVQTEPAATTTKRFDSAKELVDFILYDSWFDKHRSNFAFRGLGHHEYDLKPSAFRTDVTKACTIKNWAPLFEISDVNLWTVEKQLLTEFSLVASFYRFAELKGLAIPPISHEVHAIFAHAEDFHTRFLRSQEISIWPSKSVASIAALARHNGLPCRLLDWTANPFIALAFAVDDMIRNLNSKSISLWCIRTDILPHLSQLDRSESGIELYHPQRTNNVHMIAQAGFFTASINFQEDLEEPFVPTSLNEDVHRLLNLKECVDYKYRLREHTSKKAIEMLEGEQAFFRMELPREAARDLFQLLRILGHDALSLFPTHEGVVKMLESNRLFQFE